MEKQELVNWDAKKEMQPNKPVLAFLKYKEKFFTLKKIL